MKPPAHESPIQEYTEPTKATLCIESKSEEQLPSTPNTPSTSYETEALEESQENIRLGDVDVTLKHGDHDFMEISLINHRQD